MLWALLLAVALPWAAQVVLPLAAALLLALECPLLAHLLALAVALLVECPQLLKAFLVALLLAAPLDSAAAPLLEWLALLAVARCLLAAECLPRPWPLLVGPLVRWLEARCLPQGLPPTATTGAKTALSARAAPEFVHSERTVQILREQFDELVGITVQHTLFCGCTNCRKFLEVEVVLLEIFA